MSIRKSSNRTLLTIAIDVVVIAVVFVFVGYVYYKIETVLVYKWHWDFIPEYILRWDEDEQRYAPNLLLKGLFTTCRLVIWSMLLAAIIGVVMGVMRTANSRHR